MLAALAAAAAPRRARPARPAWVAASDAHTTVVLEAQAAFAPESASQHGLTHHDGRVVDLGPGLTERRLAAMESLLAELERRLAAEPHPEIREDLEILLAAVRDDVTGIRLDAAHYLEWYDAPQMVFEGIRGPARRAGRRRSAAPRRWSGCCATSA